MEFIYCGSEIRNGEPTQVIQANTFRYEEPYNGNKGVYTSPIPILKIRPKSTKYTQKIAPVISAFNFKVLLTPRAVVRHRQQEGETQEQRHLPRRPDLLPHHQVQHAAHLNRDNDAQQESSNRDDRHARDRRRHKHHHRLEVQVIVHVPEEEQKPLPSIIRRPLPVTTIRAHSRADRYLLGLGTRRCTDRLALLHNVVQVEESS